LLAGLGMAFGKGHSSFPAHLAFILYFTMLAIGFAPRILGALDILLRGEARKYGGVARLLISATTDTVFSILLAPVMMVAQALFVIGLIFGRRVVWEAQNRHGRAVPVAEAMRGLWPQFLLGTGLTAALVILAPAALPWAAPTILPTLLAVPFACLTAGSVLGRLMVRFGICAIPDEYAPAAQLLRLGVQPAPALALEGVDPDAEFGSSVSEVTLGAEEEPLPALVQ
jgi:membrane glycosyltransferase